MKIKAVQLYGLPKDLGQIGKIFRGFSELGLEVNLVDQSDIDFVNKIKNELNLKILGGHCNFKLYESLTDEKKEEFKQLVNRCLIIPTAVEENSLCYPLSFFRRFRWIYKNLIKLIDLFKFKACRRIVVGSGIKSKDYFCSNFWVQFAKKINSESHYWDEVGFHNHGLEFQKTRTGETPFEIFDKNLNDNISYQFDITNSVMSGYFSIDLLRKYNHRIKSFHLRIEGVGRESFYQNLIQENRELFENKELILELKEATTNEMIDRIGWWIDLVDDKS